MGMGLMMVKQEVDMTAKDKRDKKELEKFTGMRFEPKEQTF